jgi:PKD repeat protein
MIRIHRVAVLPLYLCLFAWPLLAQPRADFAWSPENPPINSLVQIEDRSVGATSTTFYIENSHPQPGAGAALAFSAPGTFELKMVATSGAGTSTKIRWINAGVPAEARMQMSRTTAGIGQSVSFQDRSSGLVQSRTWSFGDGSSSAEEAPQHAFAAAGTYTVTLRANYNSGSRTTSQTITVQGAPEPLTADFDWTPEIPFIGQTVTFREHAKGDPTSWSWSFGDDSDDQTSTSRSATHKYKKAGKYLVTLAVKKGASTVVLTRELYVASSGGVTVLEPEFTVDPSCLVAGETMQFLDRSDGFPIRWLWSFGNGRTSSDRNPRGTYDLPGRYLVTLELFDGVQTRSTTQTITVNPNFARVPRADFASPCCAAVGIVRELQNTSSDATSYRWDFGDGQTSTDRNPRHAWAQPGSYMIRLVAANEHGEHQFGRSIHVELPDTPPIADFIWEPSAHIGVGQKVGFVNRSSSDAVAFLWTVTGPGIEPRQAVTRTIEQTFPHTGTYQVRLDATDAYGASATLTREVGVVDGKLIASFQCGRTGSHSVVYQVCGGCRCTGLDPTQTRCVSREPSDCQDSNSFNGQPSYGCLTPQTAYYDDFRCTDQSSGAPDLYDWQLPHLFWEGLETKKSGRQIQFWTRIIPGLPYTLWVHHTVHRLADGESSSAIAAIPSSGGTVSALKSDFSWSPGFPRVGDEVLFEQKADGASTFEWLVNGELRLTGPSFKYTFPVGGKHEITLRAGNGTRTDARIKIIEVGPKATPAFTKVTSRWGNCFFSTVPLQTEIEATVNWGGTPARATYRINDGAARDIVVSGDTFSFPVNSQELRFSSISSMQERNTITITAKNAGGDEASINFRLDTFNTGPWLTNVQKTVREAGRYTLTNISSVPQPAWEGEIEFPSIIPFIGGKILGLKKTQGTVETLFRTDCTTNDTFRGTTGFQVGPGVITGTIFGREELQMTPGGIQSEKGTIGFQIAGAIEPAPIPILTAVPSAAPICALPAVGALCEVLKVKSEFKLAAGAEFDFARPRGEPVFQDGRGILTPSLKIGLIAKPAAGLWFEVWGGGQAAFTIHPVPPIVRRISASVESGFLLNVYLFQVEEKMAVVCDWDSTNGWKPCLGPTTVGANAGAPLALRARPVHGQGELLSRRMRMRGESVVLESLSPLAAPKAAASGHEIMAVYLAEDAGAANALHRTNVRYTTRQDGAWSESKPLTADALGDFAPMLAGASDGRFIALWQRVKNPALRLEDVATFDDLPKLNREMEVVAATWSPGSRTWSAPLALTDNDVFDHDARAVALADGRVLAVWLRDRGNGMNGTAASPTEIVMRVLSGDTWGSETVLASGLTGVEGLSAASRGNEATLAFSRDKDGNLGEGADREIAVLSFTGTAWSASRDLTTDAVSDRAPSVVYGNEGPRILWMSGADLVWQPAAGGSREVVRASEGSAAFLDATATATANGELVVVWSESNDGTADIIARTYDPALQSWSEDIALTRNDAVESSLSAFFADGKLQVTGMETNSVYSDVTRVIDGQEVVIPAVAGPGAVSLIHLDKELVVDLSIDQNTLAVSVDAPTAGQEVKLTALVCNEGDLPLRDVSVAVYAGRGASGTPLATAIVPGDWRGGESRTIEIAFPYSNAAQEVTLVVDPLGSSGDRNVANNQAYFSYRNAPPVACLQLGRMIGSAPMTVSFDARCSTDSDGRVVDARWSFGDGGAAFGDTASHTFTTQGVHAVTLTVTDDLGRSATASSSVYASSLGELRNNQASSLYLPVAGRTAGAGGTFFVSDATVFNPNRTADLVVDALYLPDGRLDYHYARLVVPPDRTLDLSDLVAKTFHGSGIGWVRFDLSDPHAVITSRSYNQQPFGTAGTLIPAATSQDAIRPGSRRVFLQDWRTGFRTNVGLTEISGDGANVVISAFDASGALAGQKSVQLAPWTHVQVNGDALFQRAGRIEMTVDSGAVLGYLSTLDNRTGDAVYQAGLEVADLEAGARWIVPTVGRLAGANGTRWRSDIRIWNGETRAQTMRLELRRGMASVEKQVVLQAGETVAYDDVIAALYPELGDLLGVLAIRGDGVLAATSRIYNESPAGGTYGMAAPPRMESQLLSAGDQRDLLQIANDSNYRCNFGLTALDEGATVRVSAFDLEGRLLGARTYDVPARANMQVAIFPDLAITTPQPAARLQVHVLNGRAYAYASVIDNKTGDAIFVEAEQ